MTPLYLISLHNTPIYQQLQLEEQLLRAEEGNFCIINRGSPRAIVMGISGQIETLLDVPKVAKDAIPIIQRFSGGGTVIVDEHTLFISFIFAKQSIPINPYPEPIIRWTSELYKGAWNIPGFTFSENDYTIADQKCGGNAQYIQKNRWLHHTSFLWDYDEANMEYLLLPPKRPHYRGSRTHSAFLTRLKHHAPSADSLIHSLVQTLGNVKPFYIEPSTPAAWRKEPHRRATKLLNLFSSR